MQSAPIHSSKDDVCVCECVRLNTTLILKAVRGEAVFLHFWRADYCVQELQFEENLELQVKNKAGSFDFFSSALDKSCDDLQHRNWNGT